MIALVNNTDIDSLKGWYIDKQKITVSKEVPFKLSREQEKFLDNIGKNIEILLTGSPEQIQEFIGKYPFDFSKITSIKRTKASKRTRYEKKLLSFHNHISNIFNYKKFRDNLGLEFIKKLGINVCPYCNRQYISIIPKTNNNKDIFSEFDHFWDKSHYPHLAISLFNLIPSCSICNSRLKHTKNFCYKSNLNPYIHSLHDYLKFSCVLNNLEEKDQNRINIELIARDGISNLDKDKAQANADIFRLEQMYSIHTDYAHEIICKAIAINDDAISGIMSSFTNLGITEQDFYRYYFGNYINSEDINRRPLSKLTIDILEELNILDELK